MRGPRSIQALLEGLQARFGWDPVYEQDKIIGLTRNGANVSLEPGGSSSFPARRWRPSIRPPTSYAITSWKCMRLPRG